MKISSASDIIFSVVDIIRTAYNVRNQQSAAPSTSVKKRLKSQFIATGRNISIACSFLNHHDQKEFQLTYLACRVLDAFEDLIKDNRLSVKQLTLAQAYLCEKSDKLPESGLLNANTKYDYLEKDIVLNLPILRQSLDTLDIDRRKRVNILITDISNAMCRIKKENIEKNTERYGNEILGRICQYVCEVLNIVDSCPIDYQVLGTTLQSVNNLRDFEKDQIYKGSEEKSKLPLLIQIAMTSVCIPSNLAHLDFKTVSRSRAAVSYLTITTTQFIYKYFNIPLPPSLRYPLLNSIYCAFSQKSFIKIVNSISSLLLAPASKILDGLAQDNKTITHHYSAQLHYETSLALEHHNTSHALALSRTLQLFRLARTLCEAIANKNNTVKLILASDLLFAKALDEIALLGDDIVIKFCEFAQFLAEKAESNQSYTDYDGDIAAFIAKIVSSGNHLSLTDCRRKVKIARHTSQQIYGCKANEFK